MQGMTKRERQVTDPEQIRHILDTARVLHLGLAVNNEPYVVPLNYGYTLEEDQLVLYMHGSLKGRKIDVMRKNPNVFFEMNCEVTPFDGKVACQYGTSYSSIMGSGTVEILDDVEAKKEGLTLFMKSQTGLDFEFTDKMVSAVNVMKITVEEYTAKHRPDPMAREKK